MTRRLRVNVKMKDLVKNTVQQGWLNKIGHTSMTKFLVPEDPDPAGISLNTW